MSEHARLMDSIPDLLKSADQLLARVTALQSALDDVRAAVRAHREAVVRHLSARPSPPVPATPPPPQPAPLAFQRAVPRWPANHVQLSLCGEDEDPFTGEAVDFSVAGLAVLVPMSLPVHSILKILFPGRPGESQPEVIARVRNCRADGKLWLTGCQFDLPLTPAQLHKLGLTLPAGSPATPPESVRP